MSIIRKKSSLKTVLLIKLGLPFVACIMLAALVLTIFDIDIDSRGPQQTIFLDSSYENPTEYSDGSYHALALVEPEALADAYYKYMSVNSHTKIVNPGTSEEVTLEFSDERETTDFATLMDYYERENYYFLSSYYIKMADEMYHKNAFYYPEQFIKPVYYDVVSDDGTTNRLKAKPLAELNDETNELVLIAESRRWQDTEPDESGILYEQQSETETEPGVWDYGFGSVIQYGDYEKDVYIKCQYESFQIHRHKHYWEEYDVYDYDTETGKSTYIGTDYEEVEVCSGSINISVAADDTIDSLRDKINSYNEPATPPGGSSWYTVEWSPSNDQLGLFLDVEHNEHIRQKISVDDESLARRKFNNSTLNNKFGNSKNIRDDRTDDDYYPVKISLIDSVATMSGAVSYQYDTDAFTTRALTSQASSDEEDPYMYMIQGECCGGTMTAKRTGDVITKVPVPTETADACGFDYIDSYAAYYQPYIPQEVTRSIDFSDRIDTTTEAGKKTLSLMISLGLLKPYGEDPSVVDSTAASNLSYSDYELLGRMLAWQGFDSQEDELYFAAMTVNRLHNDNYPNTLEEIFEDDPETYAGYADDGFYEVSPSARDLQAATLVLRGQFPVPDNVLSLYSSLSSIPTEYNAFAAVSADGGTHYYCYEGQISEYCWSMIRENRKKASTATELTDYIKSFASDSEGSVVGIGDDDSSSTDFSKYRSYCNQADVERIARMVWGEARGVYSISEASVLTQQAATVWTVLNRVDKGYGSISQIVVPSVYNGYDPSTPLSTVGPTIINLVYDVMCRWYAEKDGNFACGRVLPADYIYFYGDGKNNHFYNDYTCLTYLQRQAHAGTLSSGIASLRAQRKEWLYGMSSPYDDITGISLGHTNGGTTVLGFSSESNGYRELQSEYPLYVVESFDVISALSSMQGLADNSNDWLVSMLKESFSSVSDALSQFFDDLTSPFYDDNVLDSPVVKMDIDVDQNYARDPVYQAIAFSTSTNYSGVISSVNQMMSADGAMLLFVGKETGVGIGTVSTTVSYIPGIGVTVDGFRSPTDSYYKATTTFSSHDPTVSIAAPSNTPVKAVFAGTVIEHEKDYIVIRHEINGSVYQIKYGGLANLSFLSHSGTVQSGQVIGYAGETGYSLQVLVNGIPTNPLSIFYQPVYSVGVPFADLLGSDGDVDDAKVEILRNQLAAANNKSKGVYDRWHQRPINIGLTWECAWYAYGRGMQYLEAQGYPIATLPKTFGNGGDYYSNGSPYFVCDQTPSANSWIVWSPDPGSKYGHVAYVEAVAKNGDLLISESGSTYNAPGLRWLKAGTYGSMTSSRYGRYHLAGFVHLDQPRG